KGPLAKACEEERKPSLEEVVVSLQRQPTPATRVWETSVSNGAPDDQGGYAVYDLTSGLYTISASLPSSKWFVKAVVLRKELSNQSSSPGPNDLTTDGIEIPSGVDITGLDFLVEM